MANCEHWKEGSTFQRLWWEYTRNLWSICFLRTCGRIREYTSLELAVDHLAFRCMENPVLSRRLSQGGLKRLKMRGPPSTCLHPTGGKMTEGHIDIFDNVAAPMKNLQTYVTGPNMWCLEFWHVCSIRSLAKMNTHFFHGLTDFDKSVNTQTNIGFLRVGAFIKFLGWIGYTAQSVSLNVWSSLRNISVSHRIREKATAKPPAWLRQAPHVLCTCWCWEQTTLYRLLGKTRRLQWQILTCHSWSIAGGGRAFPCSSRLKIQQARKTWKHANKIMLYCDSWLYIIIVIYCNDL